MGLPTFAELADSRLERLTKREKIINIKVARYTAAMMIEAENKERQFIETIARMNLDGEKMDDGLKFEMQSDDAIATIESLITHARKLLAIRRS